MIRIGCSGWNYDHWRGRLYPRSGSTGKWLSIYAEQFDTVEVNATFYRLPRAKAVERWADTTPEGFCFAVKGSRYLTHVRRLRGPAEGIGRFESRIEPLRRADKLGPVLWQLPGNFKRDDELLGRFLSRLAPGRHAFEFATRAGSSKTCTRSCASTRPLSSSPTEGRARPPGGS